MTRDTGLWPSAPAPQRYVPERNPFALTAAQWFNVIILGLIMAALFLAITFGADVVAIVKGGM